VGQSSKTSCSGSSTILGVDSNSLNYLDRD
jgi:hypothetical protein